MPAQTDFYDDPSLYDILHTPGTAAEVDGLERLRQRFSDAPPAAAWLEPACGTGRYLRVAAGRGRRTIGFDLSETMITYARHRARALPSPARASFFVADMTRFADSVRHPVGLAFNLINSIRHLPDDRAMLAHFAQIAGVLAPGAVYAVGISTTGYGWEEPVEDVWQGVRGPVRVTQAVQYIPPGEGTSRVERVISHLTVARPSGKEHRDSTYKLRCYSLNEWLRLLRRSALGLHAVVDEAGRDADPPEAGYAVYVLRAP